MTFKVTKLVARAIIVLGAVLLLSQCSEAGKKKKGKHSKNKRVHRTAKRKTPGTQVPKTEWRPLEEWTAHLEAMQKKDLQRSLEETKRHIANKDDRKNKEERARQALSQPQSGTSKTFKVKWITGCLALLAVGFTTDLSPKVSTATTSTTISLPTLVEIPDRTPRTIEIPVQLGPNEHTTVKMAANDLPIIDFDPENVDWEQFLKDNIEVLQQSEDRSSTVEILKDTLRKIHKYNKYREGVEEWHEYDEDLTAMWATCIPLPKGVNDWEDLTIEAWRENYGEIKRRIDNDKQLSKAERREIDRKISQGCMNGEPRCSFRYNPKDKSRNKSFQRKM